MILFAAGGGLNDFVRAEEPSVAPPLTRSSASVADGAAALPALQVASRKHRTTSAWYADEGAYDQRLRDVEEALKKMDEKAKAEKKKAAKKMAVTAGGRIYLDTAVFTQDAVDKARVDEQNGMEFRTARLFLQGEGFNVMKYKVEFDFAHEGVVAKDVYLAIGELPLLQNVKIGHYKEPYSLDELESTRFMTFMERSTPGLLLAPARHIGIMAHGTSEAEYATYAIGAFAEKGGANTVQNDNAGAAVTMRGTWLPWYDEATDGRGLLHLGVAYSYRDAYNDEYAVSIRPESHLAHSMSLGTMTDVDARQLLGAEMAFVYGPFSVQSEYFVNWINRNVQTDGKINGGYAYFSYFLTGENRPYKKASGVFDRVHPYENFFRVRDQHGNVHMGKGAWELRYRYSYLDARDGGILLDPQWGLTTVETVGDHTLGVTWYLNPYTRMMFEYVHSGINRYLGAGEGDLNIVQMRAQIDF